jgi:mannose-6-phosphate isomerase-like protein (cupin superfamily)
MGTDETRITRTRLRDPAEGERFVPLRRELGVQAFGLNQIVLQAGERGRIHRHLHQEEVYVVLEGTLSLGVEGEEHELRPGDAARVPPPVRRQLVNRGPDRLVLLALGGTGEHQSRDGEAFVAWDVEEAVAPVDLPLPADLPADERRTT